MMAAGNLNVLERKCRNRNIVIALAGFSVFCAALVIQRQLYGAAFSTWPLYLAWGTLFALLPKWQVVRGAEKRYRLSWGAGKRELIKRSVLVLVWLCVCSAFIYSFRPNLTMARAEAIVYGAGYAGVRRAGFTARDPESENPFVDVMPVFEVLSSDGDTKYVSVSLETGSVAPYGRPG